MGEFLADDDIPLPLIEKLRRLGHDVRTVRGSEVDLEAPDEELQDTHRVMLSANVKVLLQLHRSTPHHFGYVVCVRQPDHDEVARRIDELVRTQEHLMSSIWLIERRAGSP